MKNAIVMAAVIILAITAGQWTVSQRKAEPHVSTGGLFHVTHVYDGDTVKLNNGEHVRLIGIDTPEFHDNPKLQRDVVKLKKSRETLLAMGETAARFSTKLLMDQDVRVEFDVEPRDRYQRQLAYLYLMDGTFVNDKIIREGYAYPLTIPPNVRYASQFKQAFAEAREQKRGLWK